MNWAFLTVASGMFNALWTSLIKDKVRGTGAMPFSASIRLGVGLVLFPYALTLWHAYSLKWWVMTLSAGLSETASVWTLSRGSRDDYYSTFALSNTTPLFSALAATYFLGEAMTPALALGVLCVVAGAFWLYRAGHWSWWGLWTSLLSALCGLFSKSVIAESGFAPHACFAFLSGGAAMALAGRAAGRMGLDELARNLARNRLLIGISTLATICFFSALALAPLNRVSPLVRVNMVAGFLLSVYMLGERERLVSRALGALVIMAGLVLVVF